MASYDRPTLLHLWSQFTVKPCPHLREFGDCRRKRRLSPNSATIVASVDRASGYVCDATVVRTSIMTVVVL